MVGIVLVSHSRALAMAAKELVVAMAGPKLPLRVAAGIGDERGELGTDATEILDGINEVMGEEGVLVLMDMGSAILSAETALGFLDDSQRAKVRCSSAPFVEGAIAAGVTATLGSSLEDVAVEAEKALRQKQEQLPSSNGHHPPATQNPPAQAVAPDAGPSATIRVAVPNPHGLHARPAARLIREASKFSSKLEARNVTKQRGPISLKSLSSLVSLEILQGEELELIARGVDAEEAIRTLGIAVENGLGDSLAEAPDKSGAIPVTGSGSDQRRAVAVSGGIAVGALFFASAAKIEIPRREIEDPEAEKRALHAAIEKAKSELGEEEAELRKAVGEDESAILQAQALILDDPALVQTAEGSIESGRENAARAWHAAYEQIAAAYEGLADEYIRQRAADVRDAGARVLQGLGIARSGFASLPRPGILVVDDLAPSDAANLSRDTVLGVICLLGGKTSHSAILLRARGVPAIARAKAEFDRAGIHASQGDVNAAIDGETGQLWLAPTAETLEKLKTRQDRQEKDASEEARRSSERALTTDDHAVPVWANLGSPNEAAPALEQGAEGVGLFRTEFLFLNRQDAPTEDDQVAALTEVRKVMGPRPVVIRTLDIGGDKALPYLAMPKEENPFLGVRGVRLCFAHPELFQPHLRAILRAGHGSNFRLMFPMIADPAELRQARGALEEAHRTLAAGSVPHLWPISVGIMIEVPSATVLIDQFAPLLDFFSIGTNDLTQYILAADRGSPELSHFQDALHPAVLRQIHQVTTTAHKHGKEVGVCGESAADPDSARILIGLGVDELSLSAARIPKIKAAIRTASKQAMEALAAKAMTLENAAAVRALLNS